MLCSRQAALAGFWNLEITVAELWKDRWDVKLSHVCVYMPGTTHHDNQKLKNKNKRAIVQLSIQESKEISRGKKQIGN